MATITAPLTAATATALSERWGHAWNAHDADAVAAMCAEDLVYDEPAIGPTVHGRDAIRTFVAGMARDYPDYEFTLEGVYAEVDRPALLVAWRVRGTRSDSGRAIDFHGDDRLELDADGLITHYRCLYDHHLVLSQLAEI